MGQFIMDRNPNWDMAPEDIQRVLKQLALTKDRYEAFAIIATDDTIPKHHALQWMVQWLDQYYRRKNRKLSPQPLSNGAKKEFAKLEARIEKLEDNICQ